MTYSIEQLKTMCAADIAKRSPRHVESVIEELIETAVSLAEREQVRVPKGWPERIPAGLPEYDALLDHIYEHGTAAEGVNERAAALVRAMLAAAPPVSDVEPVAYVTGYNNGYPTIAPINSALCMAIGTALYTAPPAPSVPGAHPSDNYCRQ